jgi:hypothetical protein
MYRSIRDISLQANPSRQDLLPQQETTKELASKTKYQVADHDDVH